MSKRPLICVFAGSQMPSDPVEREAAVAAAQALGEAIGREGYDILYGGGPNGLMGVVARAANKTGAHVNVITLERFSSDVEIEGADRVVAKNEFERFPWFLERKPLAFFVLPGGTGTMREALQALETIVYDGAPPVVFVRVGDFMKGIRDAFKNSVKTGFVDRKYKNSMQIWWPGRPLIRPIEKARRIPASKSCAAIS